MTVTDSPARSIDEELVQSISRWALVVTAAIGLFDAAILWSYPFPISAPVVRGVFYSTVGVAIVLGACACAFLGYRIVSLRIVRRGWRVYAIFMPLMALIGSVVWLYLLSPA